MASKVLAFKGAVGFFFPICCSSWLLLLLSLMMNSSAAGASNVTTESFEKWLTKYGRSYESPAEKHYRFGVFRRNYEFVKAFERRSGNKSLYTIGLNQFADMTNRELMAKYKGFRRPPANFTSTSSVMELVDTTADYTSSSLPASLDWRQYGAVTPIKYQNKCGSCWAFSTIAAIEGMIRIKTGKLISLSEQELIDCDHSYVDGCGGGYPYRAFQWVINNGGIASELTYPYLGYETTCNPSLHSYSEASISGYQIVPPNSEVNLKVAVAQQPVSVCINASPYFYSYTRGIFTGPCSSDYINHCVTVVGYGEVQGYKYWIVKNSWGESWGESGYMRMLRDVDAPQGLCGITLYASYPTI